VFQELKSKFHSFWEQSESTPRALRLKQRSIVCGGIVIVVSGIYFLAAGAESPTKPNQDTKVHKQDVSKIETPLAGIDEREIWVNRVVKTAKAVHEEATKVKEENQFLQKRIDVLEEIFKTQKSTPKNQEEIQEPLQNPPPPQPAFISPQTFPPSGSDMSSDMLTREKPFKKRGIKIAHKGGQLSGGSLKTAALYLPAGSYSKAVLVSGVAAATATNAQSNPQPIMLRLVDDGNLPRGFKSRVRDAVLLGACYGDISSERVLCRLETMSWVEKDGTTVEKKVEGWVMGEDGRSGLRGEVVDRSSDVAREAFGAGLLSAVANFFKYEATSSVFPVSPFGQTNAMNSKQALQGAAASGAGSALDKLADFSIKRAEQMQPVIMVASGRIVDVVFKAGVDLSPETEVAEMKVVGSNNQNITQENLEN
jgi:conjugal transfer pilus assembly protein TraB